MCNNRANVISAVPDAGGWGVRTRVVGRYPSVQYGYTGVGQRQTQCHRYDDRHERDIELARDRCHRQVPTTARRSHDSLHVLPLAV